jgi:hypothetical protein
MGVLLSFKADNDEKNSDSKADVGPSLLIGSRRDMILYPTNAR